MQYDASNGANGSNRSFADVTQPDEEEAYLKDRLKEPPLATSQRPPGSSSSLPCRMGQCTSNTHAERPSSGGGEVGMSLMQQHHRQVSILDSYRWGF